MQLNFTDVKSNRSLNFPRAVSSIQINNIPIIFFQLKKRNTSAMRVLCELNRLVRVSTMAQFITDNYV